MSVAVAEMGRQMPLLYGADEKNRILEAFRQNHGIYLATVRSFARVHAMRHGTVTIDDVHEILHEKQFPTPEQVGVTNRLFGALFCRSEFTVVGERTTRRAERVKRAGAGSSGIKVYRLREDSK